MERSSSQTRILAMGYLRGLGPLRVFGTRTGGARRGAGLRQLEEKFGALAHLRTHRDLAVVRLHDLVDNGQAQPRAAFEPALVRLEYFFHLLRRESGTAVGK